MYNKFSKLFAEQDEQFVSVLGSGNAEHFLAQGTAEQGFAVLSNERLYVKGEVYVNVGDKRVKDSASKTINLVDISIAKNAKMISGKMMRFALKLTAITIVWFVIGIPLLAHFTARRNIGLTPSTVMGIIIFLPPLLAVITSWIMLLIKRTRLLEIYYKGSNGSNATLVVAKPYVAVILTATTVLFYIIGTPYFIENWIDIGSDITRGLGRAIFISTLLAAIISWIMFFIKRKRLIEIHYNGSNASLVVAKSYADEAKDLLYHIQRFKVISEEQAVQARLVSEEQAVWASLAGSSTPTVASAPVSAANASTELKKYKSLLEQGAIDEEEYNEIKAKLLEKL